MDGWIDYTYKSWSTNHSSTTIRLNENHKCPKNEKLESTEQVFMKGTDGSLIGSGANGYVALAKEHSVRSRPKWYYIFIAFNMGGINREVLTRVLVGKLLVE